MFRLLLLNVFILSFVFLFFPSCEVQKEEKTAPLSMEKTAKIFADHIMADAATSSAVPYSRDSLQKLYYNQIFEMHDANIEEYQAALEYYSEQDSAMHMLFDQIDSLLLIPKKDD